jgi:hypothetical protein
MYVSVGISDGLGNRFFQVAAMLGYAEKYGHTPVFVKSWIKEDTSHPGPKDILAYFPNIPVIDETQFAEYFVIQEPWNEAFTYRELSYRPMNVKLSGYFQSEKYFPSYRIQSPLIQKEKAKEKAKGKECIFLHVRRGDYLLDGLGHHKVHLLDYYKKCLTTVSHLSVLVCSDDIAWCKENLPKLYINKFIWCEGNNLETLQEMANCEYGGICANSTFSWWGAYFNESDSKMVFMPGTWGYPPLPPVRDLYPSNAIVIPV